MLRGDPGHGRALALPDGRLAFELPWEGRFIIGSAIAMGVDLLADYRSGVEGNARFTLIECGPLVETPPPNGAPMTFDAAGMTFRLFVADVNQVVTYPGHTLIKVEITCRLYLTGAPRGSMFEPKKLGPGNERIADDQSSSKLPSS